MIVFLFALVWTILLTLAVRSFLSCLCCDIEDFTHLLLLLMVAGMFSNSIHGPEIYNQYHCKMNMTVFPKLKHVLKGKHFSEAGLYHL
jgi:ABC-type polysaccharide/polyol phosphate export permease